MNAVCIEQPRAHISRDTTYRQIFNGQNVMTACRHQANDALFHCPNTVLAAHALIEARVEESKYLSTKDRQSLECRQLMMVVSLAMIANDYPYSEMVKAALLRAQRKAQIGSCLYKLVHTVFTGLSRKGIRNIPNASLKKLNRATGSPLISKRGSQSAFSLTQIADSSRDALLAQIDASITQWIADEAMREFFPKISVPQC